MTRRRVLFFGNHDVGIAALDALAEEATVAGVVAHPPDPEDGVRYSSLYEHARSRGLSAIRGRGRDTEVAAFVEATAPELIWVTDYRYLITPETIAAVGGRAVNLHPSLLPAYRGRAPINWAIIEGATEVGLTAHLIDEGVDTGDILMQHRVPLADDEDVGDVLRKLMPLYRDITRSVVSRWDDVLAGRQRQPPPDQPPYPARKPADGRIDWTWPARTTRNLIRAVARPYPGAFTGHPDAGAVMIWRAAPIGSARGVAEPGTVLACSAYAMDVATGDGSLTITRWEADGSANPLLAPGTRFVL